MHYISSLRFDCIYARSKHECLQDKLILATETVICNVLQGLQSLQSRLDEQDDRSRRNNLLFHAIPDCKETWNESEARIREVLTGVIDLLSANDIERAHRLGAFRPGRHRPIIVKFANFKTKDKILCARKKLKEKDISVNEDFSPATRHARNQLAAFAKSQPNEAPFQLWHNKLIMNKKQYFFDPSTNRVTEHLQRLPHNPQNHTVPSNES